MLKKVLKEIGFVQADEDVDSCLFKHEKWDIVTCIHGDDCLASYTDTTKYQSNIFICDNYNDGLAWDGMGRNRLGSGQIDRIGW